MRKVDWLSWMKSKLHDDEALACYTVAGNYAEWYCIVPNDKDTNLLDISGCLEETLHRILEANSEKGDPVECSHSPEEIVYGVLGADREEYEDGEDLIEIDLGYHLHGPLSSFRRIPLTAIGFQKRMYERYKLLWMLDYGITLEDMFNDTLEYIKGVDIESLKNSSKNRLFNRWETTHGFSGTPYPDFLYFVKEKYREVDSRLFEKYGDKEIWILDQDSEDASEQGYFDCVLYLTPADTGFAPETLEKMKDLFSPDSTLLPLDFTTDDGQSSGIGFIRQEKADELDYEYRDLHDFVADVLKDEAKEKPDGIYRISLTSRYSKNQVEVLLCMRYGFG